MAVTEFLCESHIWNWFFLVYDIVKVLLCFRKHHAFNRSTHFPCCFMGYSNLSGTGFRCFFWVQFLICYGVSPFWHFILSPTVQVNSNMAIYMAFRQHRLFAECFSLLESGLFPCQACLVSEFLTFDVHATS